MKQVERYMKNERCGKRENELKDTKKEKDKRMKETSRKEEKEKEKGKKERKGKKRKDNVRTFVYVKKNYIKRPKYSVKRRENIEIMITRLN